MKHKLLALITVCAGAAFALQAAHAEGLLKKHHHAPPVCEPGYQIVEETIYQDVTRTVCKMVPEVHKKWVYSTIDDPYCVRCTKHGDCSGCVGPYCRQLLVKRQIELPCPTMKCVTETITERVPVTVYRKVPCGPVAPAVETKPALPMPKK